MPTQEGLDGGPQADRPADAAAANRGIFIEMIRGLIVDDQLDRRTRREAVAFARHLGIDAAQARRLIDALRRGESAAQAESAVDAAAADAGAANTAGSDSGEDDSPSRQGGLVFIAVMLLLLNAAWFWLLLGSW